MFDDFSFFPDIDLYYQGDSTEAYDLVDELALFTAPHDVAMAGESDISLMQLDLTLFRQVSEVMLGADSYQHFYRERKN